MLDATRILAAPVFACFCLFQPTRIGAAEPLTLATVGPPPEIRATEPLSVAFSLKQAAGYLDTAALHWQKVHGCGTCHTNFAYLMARPALESQFPAPREIRPFFESMIEKQWPGSGPRWDAEVVVAAVTLAFHDRATTGKLHPTTRRALDRMWTLQRPDGGWSWLKCGWPPAESDDHYGVTFAAIGVGVAPDAYAHSIAAKKGLDAIRSYLKANPPPSLHHKAMELWASSVVAGIASEADCSTTLNDLFALQRSDGGWATATLFDGWKDHKRKDNKPQVIDASDGYGTGFVVYVARQGGVAASDPRMQRALKWITKNQRASGRWFTPSPTKDSRHYITNLGTAFVVMALDACGETARPTAVSP